MNCRFVCRLAYSLERWTSRLPFVGPSSVLKKGPNGPLTICPLAPKEGLLNGRLTAHVVNSFFLQLREDTWKLPFMKLA